MSENVPPAGGEAARGQPYYEKLKRDLRQTLQNKRRIDQQLTNLEEQIFRQESQYLEDTPNGNIIRGFDNYIKGSGAGGATSTSTTRKKNAILDTERIFSRSSANYARESSPDSLSQSGPSHAPTPTRGSEAPTPTSTTGGGLQKGGGSLKRTKKGDKDADDDDSKPAKRLKMTFARGDKGAD